MEEHWTDSGLWFSSYSCGSWVSPSGGQTFNCWTSRCFKSDPSFSSIMLCLLFATIIERNAGTYLGLCSEQQGRKMRCIICTLQYLAYKFFLYKCRYESHTFDKAACIYSENLAVWYCNSYLLGPTTTAQCTKKQADAQHTI